LTEVQIVKQIKDGLEARGYLVFSTHGPRNRPLAQGVPDILAVKGGRLLAVEVKSARGSVRPEQAVFIARLKAAGAVAVVGRSWEEVEKVLW
jgi:Holliday junction resolvase